MWWSLAGYLAVVGRALRIRGRESWYLADCGICSTLYACAADVQEDLYAKKPPLRRTQSWRGFGRDGPFGQC